MNVDFGLELAPVCRANLEQMRQWRNTHSVWKYCRQNDLISDVEQERWFERQSQDPTIKMWLVVRRVDGEKVPVGVCGLTSIDMLNRRAEFSLYIGPEHHRKGYGKEAMKLLLGHAFLNLGMTQIWGESFAGNPAMALFDNLGFKRDGIRRAFYFRDGKMVDAHLYSILRDEWILSQQSSSSASSPTPSSPASGSAKGETVIEMVPSRRGRGRPAKASGAPSPSVTKELGRSNRRNANEMVDSTAPRLCADAPPEASSAE